MCQGRRKDGFTLVEVMVSLVIFMITAPLLTTGVEVDLPESDAKSVKAESVEPVVLSVNSLGDWFLNLASNPEIAITEQTAIGLVRDALQQDPQRSVRVAADKTIDYGRVMRAMAALQVAGAAKVQLMSDTAR